MSPRPKPRKVQDVLTPAQLQMYASEKLVNFRWISKILATHSPYTLTAADLASADLEEELGELGQFAELAYGFASCEFVYQHLETLAQTDFPLHGYDALQNTTLVAAFRGTVAGLHACVVHRPATRQLILGISGTITLKQTIYDLRSYKRSLPKPYPRGCKVHGGFWRIYQGLKRDARSAIRKGLQERDVGELVVTGHSLGGVLSYLLTLDLLVDSGDLLPSGLPIKIAVFGAPRGGNAKLAEFWSEVVDKYQERNGRGSVTECCVKAYNDGVPALPPLTMGYRHFTRTPLYFARGRLYHVPPTEAEYTLFHVSPDSGTALPPVHPRGGHNYYNGRDMEKLSRRMQWLDKAMSGEASWTEQYRLRVLKHEKPIRHSLI